MEVSPSFPSDQDSGAKSGPVADPRLQPTPDYGTLGPGSNVALGQPNSTAPVAKVARVAPLIAIAIGVFAAGLVLKIGSMHAWPSRANVSPVRSVAPTSTGVTDTRPLDRLKPQKQAETLLEQAIGRSGEAVDQISSRVNRWQGKLQWDSQMATLTTAALNSNDMRVRESGVEIELAAYGLGKNGASLDYLLKTAESSDRAQKIWALWALGLIGNRGVEPEHVVQALTAHLKDSDEESRRWAVEGLALVGANQAIEPLLRTMHDDPSPAVRERAACSLAQSGMFTEEQRAAVVPRLLSYTDDPSLDAQTHAWAFQALGDITRQRLPNDAAAWREWYEKNSGQ